MPYLNSLASQYDLATQYFANTHPSIGNYFMLTTGQPITFDDMAKKFSEWLASNRKSSDYLYTLPPAKECFKGRLLTGITVQGAVSGLPDVSMRSVSHHSVVSDISPSRKRYRRM